MDFDPYEYTILNTACADILTNDIVLYKNKVYYFKNNGINGILYENFYDFKNNENKIYVMRTYLKRVRESWMTDETEPPRIKPVYASTDLNDYSSEEETEESVVDFTIMQNMLDRKTLNYKEKRIDTLFDESLERARKDYTPEAHTLLVNLAKRYTQIIDNFH